FSTMLGEIPSGQQVELVRGMPRTNDGVVSFIGLAGNWAGTGCISCSSATACRVFSQMLLVGRATVDEDVLDAVGELTNMIIGSVKTELEEFTGPLGLSLPTVVYGRNFITRNTGQPEWTVAQFHLGGEDLTVRLCLARTERLARVAQHSL